MRRTECLACGTPVTLDAKNYWSCSQCGSAGSVSERRRVTKNKDGDDVEVVPTKKDQNETGPKSVVGGGLAE